MKRIIINLCIVMLLIFSQGCSPKKGEISAIDKRLIEEKINMYFEGWLTGDSNLLGKAMHSTCQLKNIKEDDVIIIDRPTYLGFFSPRPRRKNAGGKILNIDITGPIGSAKIELETQERLYTDYFNLMKVDGEWFIVDKISTNSLKEEKT